MKLKEVIKIKEENYRKDMKNQQGKKGTDYSIKAMEVYNATYGKGRGRI